MIIKKSYIAIVLTFFCILFSAAKWKDSASIPQSLVGKWNVIQFHSVHKDAYPKKQSATVQIDADGMTTGFVGCNRIRTTCVVDDDSIRFGTILSTRKFCQKEYMDVEDYMKEVLSNSNMFILKNDMLMLFSGKKKLVTFKKE